MRKIARRALGWVSIALIGTALIAFPATVAAKDGDVIRTGNCSGSTDWKLKLSPDDGRIEVEAEIDSNVNGQSWAVKLKRNGSVFWSGTRTTQGPSGSFEVRRLATNGAGTDNFIVKATNRASGETCRGTASI